MSHRFLGLSGLSLAFLLSACDGGGNAVLTSDLPTAGSPDAPAVVTKGKVPGSSDNGAGEVPASTIVGTWTRTDPATDSSLEELTTAVFRDDGTGRVTIVAEGEKDTKLSLTWKKSGAGYAVMFMDSEGEQYVGQATIVGTKLTITFADLGILLELHRES